MTRCMASSPPISTGMRSMWWIPPTWMQHKPLRSSARAWKRANCRFDRYDQQDSQKGVLPHFRWSGCRDLNSGPSVPQTGRAEPGPFHTGRKQRHDTVPDTGCRLRTTAGGPDRARNVTRRVTRAVPNRVCREDNRRRFEPDQGRLAGCVPPSVRPARSQNEDHQDNSRSANRAPV